MKKQTFTFRFPQTGIVMTNSYNPLAVMGITKQILKNQYEVFGDTCMVFNDKQELIAMAYIDEHLKVKFFTEDDSINCIRQLGDISPEVNEVKKQ